MSACAWEEILTLSLLSFSWLTSPFRRCEAGKKNKKFTTGIEPSWKMAALLQ